MAEERQTIHVGKLDKHMKAESTVGGELQWFSPMQTTFQISGFAWFQEEQTYRRLPKQPKYEITEAVDILANCTAGGQIRFRTNATTLRVKVKLQGKANMYHMPATGECGFDCYIGDPGNQRFCGVTSYNHSQEQYEANLFERQEDDSILVTLHFPLYQGVEKVQIGLNANAVIQRPPDYDCHKKLIFLWDIHSPRRMCFSPRNAYTNILSRRFNQEFINLGFSGNGKGEAEMARLIREIEEPACLVLDYEPNCVSTALYKETLPRFIQIYRETHPTVPILVISKYPYAHERVNSTLQQDRSERLTFQKQLIQQLQTDGDSHLYFMMELTYSVKIGMKKRLMAPMPLI